MRWLIDEMLPPSTAATLNELGHDAVAVRDVDLIGAADDDVYTFAVSENRIVVTENFADFSRLAERQLARTEPSVPIVFVRKRDFRRGGGLAKDLARHLDRWSKANPDPHVGIHWP